MTVASPPILEQFYQRYLERRDVADFICSVANRYAPITLHRLAVAGSRTTRRGAVQALTFLGNFSSNPVLAHALHDSDRGVRLLAEDAIRAVWFRQGGPNQRQQLKMLQHLNASRQFYEVLQRSGELLRETPWVAEAWNQRAIAFFHCERYREAIRDCLQTLQLNPYHYAAAVGMADCYVKLDDRHAALRWLWRALDIHPDLERVRLQILSLQRTLEER